MYIFQAFTCPVRASSYQSHRLVLTDSGDALTCCIAQFAHSWQSPCRDSRQLQVSTSMVIVQKPSGHIRVCLDPKDLNAAIRREYYPIPTIEEVSTRLKNPRLFTVLDAKNGFRQIPLDEKSNMLTCFNSPFGRYRWLRMPFGINSSPEIWQRTMNQLVEGMAGTEVIHDDFVKNLATVLYHLLDRSICAYL